MHAMTLPLALSLSTSSPSQPHPKLLNWINETYSAHVSSTLISTDTSAANCVIQHLRLHGQDPISLKPRAIELDVYHPRGERAEAPAVIILPPTGGVNILDRGYASALCDAGVRAAVITGWESQTSSDLEMKMHDRAALRALTAVRHVIEYLGTPKHLGILGTSVGAMTAVLALGFEPRLHAGALIVGAGNFVDILAESTEFGAAQLRLARMKAYGLKTVEEYRQALRREILTEPLDFVNYSGAKESLMITADNDLTVPTSYQLELVNRLQPRTHLALPGTHLEVIKNAFFNHRTDIVNFFNETLR